MVQKYEAKKTVGKKYNEVISQYGVFEVKDIQKEDDEWVGLVQYNDGVKGKVLISSLLNTEDFEEVNALFKPPMI